MGLVVLLHLLLFWAIQSGLSRTVVHKAQAVVDVLLLAQDKPQPPEAPPAPPKPQRVTPTPPAPVLPSVPVPVVAAPALVPPPPRRTSSSISAQVDSTKDLRVSQVLDSLNELGVPEAAWQLMSRLPATRWQRHLFVMGTPSAQADEETEVTTDELVRLSAHPKVVAIGEAGLDYHYDLSPRDAQERGFRNHIAAARMEIAERVRREPATGHRRHGQRVAECEHDRGRCRRREADRPGRVMDPRAAIPPDDAARWR